MWARVALLPIRVTGSDAQWKKSLEQVSTVLDRVVLKDHDCAWCLELAGKRAEEAGKTQRALFCYTSAAAHWRSVGEPERADAIDAHLAG